MLELAFRMQNGRRVTLHIALLQGFPQVGCCIPLHIPHASTTTCHHHPGAAIDNSCRATGASMGGVWWAARFSFATGMDPIILPRQGGARRIHGVGWAATLATTSNTK